MSSIRIFVSSVQKELGLERAAVAQLVSLDPFLAKHCAPVLYENEPTSGRPDKKAYLKSLDASQVYVLLIDLEYGWSDGGLSATHEEYREAQEKKLPTAVFIKGLDGKNDGKREPKTKEFLDEIKKDGHKYRRFHDREDLKPAVREALHVILAKEFEIAASGGEQDEAEHQIEAASPFETTTVPEVPVAALDEDALGVLVKAVFPSPGRRIWNDARLGALLTRGLAQHLPPGEPVLTRAAILLFHPTPAVRFPQCEILADAYDGDKITGRPRGQENINAPLLQAVEQALAFIDKHTFHPHRVVGLNNVRLDEYPARALREVLVNALAHRDYGDPSRKVIVRVFSDRLEVASPGYPLKPLTLAKLQKGNYRPCSRNPLVTQTLALFQHMEQRGTGFARIREAMLDHGLELPQLATGDGYFVVTLAGPDGDYERIRVSGAAASGPITPALEAKLNERQKGILVQVQQAGTVTRGWCVENFQVANDTAGRDLKGLVELGLLQLQGSGRSAHYVWQPAGFDR
jgi:predicted HTH transcriptional regulator